MTSITKIVILITVFIAISGYALDVLGDDMNQPDAQVSDTPSSVKRDPPYLRRYGSLSERRQTAVNTQNSDDDPNSLLDKSSYSLGSIMRNRRAPETPTNQNTTVKEHPHVVRNRPAKMSNVQRILISLFATLAVPGLIVTPNHDYDYDTSELITS